ncbi:MAG: dihydrofolate reductase [Treponema sp.]|jgi:dihydrofolate reductase|nr:dihydrofolate reductase [Treponema sp.]
MREIIIIVAMAENNVIGNNNKLPWSIKEDIKHFRELTNGCPCIMGRKTWESLPKKPLPGRLNIIISTTMTDIRNSNTVILPSLPAAIEYCRNYEKIFICGGEAIYRQSINLATKIELTLIHRMCEGDASFPEIDSNWNKIKSVDFDTFSFITYIKRE